MSSSFVSAVPVLHATSKPLCFSAKSKKVNAVPPVLQAFFIPSLTSSKFSFLIKTPGFAVNFVQSVEPTIFKSQSFPPLVVARSALCIATGVRARSPCPIEK